MIKLLIVGRGRVGMDSADQRAYMKDVHGAAVVRLIAEEPDVAPRRYVQNHVSASYASGGAPADPRDFVTQVWFDDPAQMRSAMTTPRYVEHLQPDEDNFVHQASVTVLPAEASVLRAQEDGTSAKVFVLYGSDGPGLAVLGDEHRVRGHVRNVVVRPDAPYAVVDELWFDDDAAAGAAAAALVASAAPAVLLVAREHVLHAGPES